MQTQNDEVALAAVVAVACAGQGMNDVVKQQDVKFYTEAIVQFIRSQHPRVRFECLNAISILSKMFTPKMQKYHQLVIPALCEEMGDPVMKVSVHASTAMVNFLSGMSYELIYDYLQTIYNMIK